MTAIRNNLKKVNSGLSYISGTIDVILYDPSYHAVPSFVSEINNAFQDTEELIAENQFEATNDMTDEEKEIARKWYIADCDLQRLRQRFASVLNILAALKVSA